MARLRAHTRNAMLHVTNGACALGLIARAGTGGSTIAWRDVLHEGPAAARLSASALRHARARWSSGNTAKQPDRAVGIATTDTERGVLGGTHDHVEGLIAGLAAQQVEGRAALWRLKKRRPARSLERQAC